MLGESRGFIFLDFEEIAKVWQAAPYVNAFFSHHRYNVTVI